MSTLRIAHLSDPHFGTVLPGVRESLIECLAEIKPNLVLLTGDITQRARRSQFLEAKCFTDEINPIPLIAVPGNHDIPLFNFFGRFLNPYGGFRSFFKDRLEKDFIFGDVLVTGLNSTSRWRHVQGDFNLERLEKRLVEKKNQARIRIAAFHHPMDCAQQVDEKNLLKQREASIEIFEKNGIDLIVGGHIHDPFVRLSTSRYPRTRRAMILAVAGTCLSKRTRAGAPNSFNQIDIHTHAHPQISVSRYDLVGSHFCPLSKRTFQRGASGSWESISI
jgi:3',5'-cyclic AMP phosphodiesterase CpdA